jgi:hypothetical protein
MSRRVTLVGALTIGYGALVLLAACAVVVLVAGLAAAPLMDAAEELPVWILAGLPGGIALFVALLGILDIAFGAALLKHRPWARVPAMVLAVFKLFSLPIGTAIGVYTLWVLTRYPTLENDLQPACCQS